MRELFKPSPVMRRDGARTHVLFSLIALIVAIALFLAASGSGNPETLEPLPDWVNTGSNLICVVIGLLVLLPRTRAGASLAAGLNMVASMFTNYWVDGPDYFLTVLPFNVITLILALGLAWHYRDDLGS
jgi:preprotein translocase subunit SecG